MISRLSELVTQLKGQDAVSGLVRRCEQAGLTAEQRTRVLRLAAVTPEVADLTADELHRAFPQFKELDTTQQFDELIELSVALSETGGGGQTYSKEQVAEQTRQFLVALEYVPEALQVLHAAGRPAAEVDALVKKHAPWLSRDWWASGIA